MGKDPVLFLGGQSREKGKEKAYFWKSSLLKLFKRGVAIRNP